MAAVEPFEFGQSEVPLLKSWATNLIEYCESLGLAPEPLTGNLQEVTLLKNIAQNTYLLVA